MNGDKMTPIERWKALVTGDPVDRVPVMPLSQGHTALINGYPNLGDFYSKLDVMVRCQEIGKELYGYDQPIQLLCIGVIAEFGTKILWPYNPKMGSAVAADHPVKKAEDVDKLEVPDITKSAVAKQVVELSKKLMAKKEMPMVLIGGGWITMVTPWLVSMENFMRWVIYQPELCHKLIKKSCDYGIQQIDTIPGSSEPKGGCHGTLLQQTPMYLFRQRCSATWCCLALSGSTREDWISGYLAGSPIGARTTTGTSRQGTSTKSPTASTG